MWGYATHPNIAGVLMVGLGCEAFEIERMKRDHGLVEGDHFQTMTIQGTGGTQKSIAEGADRLKAMLPLAAKSKRETRPASDVILALQCGGSDGNSGITANPALGVAADLLVAHGGTAILSETPEIYGAEHLLTRRAVNRAVGEKLVERIKWWEDYTARNKMEMNNNPSPGNKAGGLTTILEKSLGAVAKGGTSTLMEVYRIRRAGHRQGLRVHGHARLRPGRRHRPRRRRRQRHGFHHRPRLGFGCKPTPSIKIATNTDMYRRMIDDMDINCGDVLDGVSLEDKGREIFEFVLRVASGERTKSELLGYGDEEFVPWQTGATM